MVKEKRKDKRHWMKQPVKKEDLQLSLIFSEMRKKYYIHTVPTPVFSSVHLYSLSTLQKYIKIFSYCILFWFLFCLSFCFWPLPCGFVPFFFFSLKEIPLPSFRKDWGRKRGNHMWLICCIIGNPMFSCEHIDIRVLIEGQVCCPGEKFRLGIDI